VAVSVFVMKTNHHPFWKVLFIGLIALPLSADEPKEAPSLQVKIDTPTVFDLTIERDIDDAFLAQLDTAFRRSGYDGRIAELSDLDEPAADIPLLSVRLMDWERNRTGFVECRFTAELTTMDGQVKRLGAFYGTAMALGRSDSFSMTRAFEDAAINALRDLHRDLEKLDTAHADRAATR
jgi:hypothetical protein